MENSSENPQEVADSAVEAEPGSSQEIPAKIRQLIEKIDDMSSPEVEEIFKALSYQEILALTTLGMLAEKRAKEMVAEERAKEVEAK